MTFQPGDLVVYTNEHSRKHGYFKGREYENLVGKKARVTSSSEANTCIKWVDDVPKDSVRSVYTENLRLYLEPSKEEIDAALYLLKMAGDVTFKPKFKDWKKSVNLNQSYAAEVSATQHGVMIKVGCQTFLPEAVEGLARVVAEARKYYEDQGNV